MSDNNNHNHNNSDDDNGDQILDIPQKPHRTVINKSAMDLDLKSKPLAVIHDNGENKELSPQDILGFQHNNLTSLEARTHMKEESKHYGSSVMKSLLYPLVRYKYLGLIILIILFILDKLSLTSEVHMNVEDQWGVMSVIGIAGLVAIVILAQVIDKVLYIQEKENHNDNN